MDWEDKDRSRIIRVQRVTACWFLGGNAMDGLKWQISFVRHGRKVTHTTWFKPFIPARLGYVPLWERWHEGSHIVKGVLIAPELIATFAATSFFQVHHLKGGTVRGIPFRAFSEMDDDYSMPLPPRELARGICEDLIKRMGKGPIPLYKDNVHEFVGWHSLEDNYFPVTFLTSEQIAYNHEHGYA